MGSVFYAVAFCDDEVLGPYDTEHDIMIDPKLFDNYNAWPVVVIEVSNKKDQRFISAWFAHRNDSLEDEVEDRKRGRRWMYPPAEDEEGPFNYEDSVQRGGN